MTSTTSQSVDLQRYTSNIWLYGILKIFTKRVFLPLTTIYLVQVAHLSIAQIGLLAAISAFTSFAFEVPTGYFADRFSRRASLSLGGLLAVGSSLTFAFAQNFPGAVIATVIEAIAYAFVNGAGEALIHDTLIHLKREHDYPKIVGRAQSVGLIGNIFLVGLVPLTYGIDKRLPFIFGAIAFLSLFAVARLMTEPIRASHLIVTANPIVDLGQKLRRFVTRYSFLFFLTIGILSALYNSTSDFTNLIFLDLHINTDYLGAAFAASSMVGIVGGFLIHHLRRLTVQQYIVFDLFVFSSYLLSIGLSHNLWVAVVGFVISMGFWRLRSIMYQHYLLQAFKHSSYKATLISLYQFFLRTNEMWLPFVFVATTSTWGYYHAYTVIGVASALVLLPMSYAATRLLKRIDIS